MNLYTIKDEVAQEYGPVFEAKNHDVARRAYRKLLVQNQIEDVDSYKLYCLLSFDNETGLMILEDGYSSMVSAIVNTNKVVDNE